MDKLLIIDGSSMLSINYFGSLPETIKAEPDREKQKQYYDEILKTSKGAYTNGVYGSLKEIIGLIRNQHFTHMAICFDISKDTFRKKLYPSYKGTRPDTPLPLKEQFITLQKVLERMNFKVFVNDEYEADDLAGTLTKAMESKIDTYVLTKDHDYYQLVSDKTKLWLRLNSKKDVLNLCTQYNIDNKDNKLPDKYIEITPRLVKEMSGVHPSQIPDLKGIIKDASDNIPGIKGIGKETAYKLITEYESLENLYEVIHKVKDNQEELNKLLSYWKSSLGITRNPINALLKNSEEDSEGTIAYYGQEAGLLSKKLATIVTDIESVKDFSLEDLRIGINKAEYYKCLEELEIEKL